MVSTKIHLIQPLIYLNYASFSFEQQFREGYADAGSMAESCYGAGEQPARCPAGLYEVSVLARSGTVPKWIGTTARSHRVITGHSTQAPASL